MRGSAASYPSLPPGTTCSAGSPSSTRRCARREPSYARSTGSPSPAGRVSSERSSSACRWRNRSRWRRACRSRRSTTSRAIFSRSSSTTRLPRRRGWRSSFRAGTPASTRCARWGAIGCSATPSTMRPGRRSTRWPSCSDSPTREERWWTGWRATEIRARSISLAASPGGPARSSTSPSAGSRPRSRSTCGRAAGFRKARSSPICAPRSRRPFATRSRSARCGRRERRGSRRWSSAEAWRRTPGCDRWPTSAAPRKGLRCTFRRRGCAPTTGR